MSLKITLMIVYFLVMNSKRCASPGKPSTATKCPSSDGPRICEKGAETETLRTFCDGYVGPFRETSCLLESKFPMGSGEILHII